MRIFLILALFAFSALAQASSTLRVGNHVLTAGDSRERVVDLLGKPSSKSHTRKTPSSSHGVRVQQKNLGGEQWRYRRGDHVTVVTLVDGRVTEIDDRRI